MKGIDNLLNSEVKVINLGLEGFYEELKKQGVKVIQVDWKPPAGGDKRLIELLNKLK